MPGKGWFERRLFGVCGSFLGNKGWFTPRVSSCTWLHVGKGLVRTSFVRSVWLHILGRAGSHLVSQAVCGSMLAKGWFERCLFGVCGSILYRKGWFTPRVSNCMWFHAGKGLVRTLFVRSVWFHILGITRAGSRLASEVHRIISEFYVVPFWEKAASNLMSQVHRILSELCVVLLWERPGPERMSQVLTRTFGFRGLYNIRGSLCHKPW